MFGLTKKEERLLRRLNTPIKIQNYLDSIPQNWEEDGATHYSPRALMREKKAHCIEGAAFAAAALWVNGEKPLLMDLYALDGVGDVDHVVALYKREGRWGAISKTNHATIRFRDPVYKTLRELALSYFHEWFMNTNGVKTLESFSTRALDMRQFGDEWVTTEENLFWLDDKLNALPHAKIIPAKMRKYLRKADAMELKAGRFIEWEKPKKRR